jgi:hypothetical protein
LIEKYGSPRSGRYVSNRSPSKRLSPINVHSHRNPRESRTMRLTRSWASPSAEVYTLSGRRSAAADAAQPSAARKSTLRRTGNREIRRGTAARIL